LDSLFSSVAAWKSEKARKSCAAVKIRIFVAAACFERTSENNETKQAQNLA
jgi:hypothetical protein